MDTAFYKYQNGFSPRNTHYIQTRPNAHVKPRVTRSRDYADSAAARSNQYHHPPPAASSVYSPFDDENQDPSGIEESIEKTYYDEKLQTQSYGGGSMLPYHGTPVYMSDVTAPSALGSKREQFIEMGIPTGSDDEESVVSLEDVSLSSALPAYCIPIDLSRLGNPHRRMKFGPFYEDSQKDKEELGILEGEESLIHSCSTIGSSSSTALSSNDAAQSAADTVKLNKRSSWFRKKVPQELLDMDDKPKGTLKKRSGSVRSKSSKVSSAKSAEKEKDSKKKSLLTRVFRKN